MRVEGYPIRIAIFCLVFLSCSNGIEREVKLELFSPSGSHKIIKQNVDGGAVTEHINKVFLLRSDLKVKKDSIPVLLTVEGNIINIFWIDDKNILIIVKSESLISYQVVKYYGTNIFVKTENCLSPNEGG